MNIQRGEVNIVVIKKCKRTRYSTQGQGKVESGNTTKRSKRKEANIHRS